MKKAILAACLAAGALIGPGLLAGTRCHATISGETHVAVPGRAFSSVSTADGCTLFVSMHARQDGTGGGIAVIDLRTGPPKLVRAIPVKVRNLGGMALTHNGRFLLLGALNGISVYDVTKLLLAAGEPLVGQYIPKIEQAPLYFNIAVTADDKFVFASEHNSQSVTVINLEKTAAAGFKNFDVVGEIPVGYGSNSVVLSPNGRYLYVGSQLALDSWNWQKTCRRTGAPATAPLSQPAGAVQVIDTAKAIKDPAHSVLTTTPAGCDTARVILDKSGRHAYVSSRSDDQVLSFDAERLISDPAHARLASMPTRVGPVGLALIDGGKSLAVANAVRFSGGKKDTEGISLLDLKDNGAPHAGVASPGPVDLYLMPDRKVLAVTNYETEQVSFFRVQDLYTKR